MRQITAQTCQSVEMKKNFTKANMIVYFEPQQNLSLVYLHGNLISSYDHNTKNLYIRSAGWKTVTTKDRLNGLIDYFGINAKIYQKDFIWYISTNKGDIAFHDAFNTELEIDPYSRHWGYRNSMRKFEFINISKLA